MPYSNSPINEIKERLNIVDIVREYVPQLIQAGTNFKARCPFHNEKTPSFMVSQEKQIWHCFGCGAGGDVLAFVKQIEGVEFPEVLRILARKAGVTLRQQDPKLISQKTRLLDLMSEAVDFFISRLSSKEGQPARDYLKERLVSVETIKDWQIGWAPDKWEALGQHLRGKGFTDSQILNSGMAVDKSRTTPNPSPERREDNRAGYYDRFRGRIMFPIRDVNSSVVGFTGRVLVETERSGGKYVNTPQTVLYDKSRVVFGLDKARQEIRKKDLAVVVEGQMDVTASHQAGIKNVVACSGTALTLEQIKLLSRYTKNLTLSFDIDAAGAQATQRSIDLCLAQGLNVKIIQIVGAKDPDECLKKFGVEVWQQAISGAKPVMNYYFETVFAQIDIAQLDGRREAARRLLPKIAQLPDKIEQDFWLKELGQRLGVDELILRESAAKIEKKGIASPIANRSQSLGPLKQARTREAVLAERLLALIFKFPQSAEILSQEINLDFLAGQEKPQTLAKNFVIYYNKIKSRAGNQERVFDLINLREFENSLPIETKDYFDTLLLLGDKEFPEGASLDLVEREVKNMAVQLKKSFLIRKLREIEAGLKKAEGDHEQKNLDDLSQRFNELVQELYALQ